MFGSINQTHPQSLFAGYHVHDWDSGPSAMSPATAKYCKRFRRINRFAKHCWMGTGKHAHQSCLVEYLYYLHLYYQYVSISCILFIESDELYYTKKLTVFGFLLTNILIYICVTQPESKFVYINSEINLYLI